MWRWSWFCSSTVSISDWYATEYLTLIDGHFDVLNHALRNIDAARVRMHVYEGNYEGPHTYGVEIGVILPTLMQAKPVGLLFETSNPRHQHDWNYVAEMLAIISEDRSPV